MDWLINNRILYILFIFFVIFPLKCCSIEVTDDGDDGDEVRWCGGGDDGVDAGGHEDVRQKNG